MRSAPGSRDLSRPGPATRSLATQPFSSSPAAFSSVRPALVGQPHRVEVLDREARPRAADPAGPPVSIVGPLCTGLDTFAVGAALAVPDRGDLVAIRDVGAYGFTESMPLFLSHATPAEVAIRGGRVALIRPRMEPETWLDLQRLPDW